MKKTKKKLAFKKKKIVTAYLFILPWVLGLIIFFLPPVIDTLYSSFCNYSIDRSTGMTFIGLDNFKTLFNPAESILKILIASFTEVLYTIPVALIFSLFIAIILNSKFKGRGIIRTIFFLPLIFGLNIINVVVKSNPVNAMMDNEILKGGSSLKLFSVDNAVSFIYKSGLPIEFLNPIISSINSIFSIITFTGVQILLFLAALQSIDKTLYEVAEIEGANKYECFWKITLPSVLPAMRIVVVYTVIDAVLRTKAIAFISSAEASRYTQGVISALSFLIIFTSLVLILIFIAIIPKGGHEIDNKKLRTSKTKVKKMVI